MPDATITLTYDPLQLPTAQHRAGLAGLLLLKETLEARRDRGADVGALPEHEIVDDGAVRITLSKASLQTVLDELFEIHWDERRSKSAPKGTGFRNPPIEEAIPHPADPKKTIKQFTYDVLVPKAGFYDEFGPADDKGRLLWQKLWRDAVWATLRGRPKSRLPYEQRRDKKPVDLGPRLWADLTHKKLGAEKASAFSEALLIGAQSETADGVPFEGSTRETLLLYFWPIVTLVGQARQIKVERKGGRTSATEDDAGYVFTVPDVSDPGLFAWSFRQVLGELDPAPARDGYRPAHGIWALPQEGALEYLHAMMHLASSDAERGRLIGAVTGFEIYQLMKRGNNVPILSVGRVEASERLADDYARVRNAYWSPVFRAQVIRNLLRDYRHGDTPWYRDFGDLFARYDWNLFAGDAATAFSHDARNRLQLDAETAARGRERR